MSTSDMCEALKTAMTEITVDGLTGAGITWTADGEPTKEPKAVKVVVTETTDDEGNTVKTGSYAAM